MRWIFIILLMCNGIYFLWQNYLVSQVVPANGRVVDAQSEGKPTLSLLKERLQGGGGTVDEPSVRSGSRVESGSSGAQPGSQKVENICWQIGPFKEEVSGKLVVDRLASLDIQLQLYSMEVADKPDYWVHIPPQVSRREAIKLLRELQAKKIDSFLITEGELANGISLGFFTQKDRAESVHESRREQGYDARIKTIPRAHKELWAVFEEGQQGKFSDTLWEKIQEGNLGIERRKNYCDKIASASKFD